MRESDTGVGCRRPVRHLLCCIGLVSISDQYASAGRGMKEVRMPWPCKIEITRNIISVALDGRRIWRAPAGALYFQSKRQDAAWRQHMNRQRVKTLLADDQPGNLKLRAPPCRARPGWPCDRPGAGAPAGRAAWLQRRGRQRGTRPGQHLQRAPATLAARRKIDDRAITAQTCRGLRVPVPVVVAAAAGLDPHLTQPVGVAAPERTFCALAGMRK